VRNQVSHPYKTTGKSIFLCGAKTVLNTGATTPIAEGSAVIKGK
jgi:hypothetical protein